MIIWEQCSGPIRWRSKDRRYTVSEQATNEGIRFRAIHVGNMSVDWSGSLCVTPEASKVEADAENAKRQAVTA